VKLVHLVGFIIKKKGMAVMCGLNLYDSG